MSRSLKRKNQELETKSVAQNQKNTHLFQKKNDTARIEENMAEFESTTLSTATRLLTRRKEVVQMQQVLHEKREEYNKRIQDIKERERQLSMQRNELTDNIIELDKFIKV